MLWDKWSHTRKVRALSTMDEYVRTHGDTTAYNYWCDSIKKLEANTNVEEIYETIADNDELFSNALFVFYIAATTDTSWLDQVAKVMMKNK